MTLTLALNLSVYLALCAGLAAILMFGFHIKFRPVRFLVIFAVLALGLFGDLLARLDDQRDGVWFVLAAGAVAFGYAAFVILRARRRMAAQVTR